MKFRNLALLTVLSLLMFVAGQGCPPPMNGDNGDGNGDGNGDDIAATVVMEDIQFVPDSVTISVGETVQWTNNDIVLHTVTSGNPEDEDPGQLFDSGSMGPGATYTHTFTSAGEFVYYCEFHPEQMRDAVVIVEE